MCENVSEREVSLVQSISELRNHVDNGRLGSETTLPKVRIATQ